MSGARSDGGTAGHLPWWGIAAAGFVLLGLAFGIALLAEQWTELGRLGVEARALGWRLAPGWLLAALLIATADLIAMAAVWAFLFRSTGGGIGIGEGIRIWVFTNIGRYIPGKVWQIGGLAAYMRRTGRSGAGALFSSLAFQVLVLGTGTATAAALLGPELTRLPGGAVLAALAMVTALLPLLHPLLLERVTRVAARLLREEVETRRLRGGDLARAAVGLVAAWVANGVGLWCLLRGLLGASPLAPLPLAGAFAAAYVVGYVVLVAPSGLVVREGALAALLAGLAGLPLAAAAALAVAARGWAVASELLALALVAGAGRRPTTGVAPGARDPAAGTREETS